MSHPSREEAANLLASDGEHIFRGETREVGGRFVVLQTARTIGELWWVLQNNGRD